LQVPLILKTCTYAMLHMVVSFGISWYVSGNLMVAVGISLLEPAAQIGAYFCHEKAWHLYSLRHPGQAAPEWNLTGECPLHDHHHGHHHHHEAPRKDEPPKTS
jgi:uncharacterized membrane protein